MKGKMRENNTRKDVEMGKRIRKKGKGKERE